MQDVEEILAVPLLGVIPEFPETLKIASYLRSNHKGIKTRIQFISRETDLFDRVSKYGSGHDLAASLREHFDASDECRFCEMNAVENVKVSSKTDNVREHTSAVKLCLRSIWTDYGRAISINFVIKNFFITN